MKFGAPAGLALLYVFLIGAAPSVSAPPSPAHPSLSPKICQRFKTTASEDPWQRKAMMGLSRTEEARVRPTALGDVDGIWAQEPSISSPGPRVEPTAIYDPVRDRMVVFGGASPSYVNDVWALSLSGAPIWTQLTPSGTPPSARYAHTAIYDPVRDRMIVFGGTGDAGFLNDAWALYLAGSPTWVVLTPTGTPPDPMIEHTAIYDPVRDRMVVFGGASDNGYLNDVWALSLAGAPEWMQLTPTGAPPSGRYAHSAVYDPVRDRMLIFGGYFDDGADHNLNDVWGLSLAGTPAWTELLPAGVPSGRVVHRSIYDPVRDRMVVFGGRVFNGDFNNEVWEFSLTGSPEWSLLTPSGVPPDARGGHDAIYDPVRDRMVVFAGLGDPGLLNDLWSLRWGTSTGTPQPQAENLVRLGAAFPNPARSDVSIKFTLLRSSETTLRIYDVSGHLVRTLAEGMLPAGSQLFRWDRRLASGALAPSGSYFYELRVNREKLARRVVLIR